MKIGVDRGFNLEYDNFIKSTFPECKIIKFNKIDDNNVNQIKNLNIFLFTGGSDVSPSLYDDKMGKFTIVNKSRDNEESYIFDILPFHILKLGICRGSQLVTAMSGGKIIQHVENHDKNHIMQTINNSIYNVTSTHHQMMFPYNLRKESYKILGWSEKYRSNVYLNGNNKQIKLPNDFLEPEIVYYNNTNSLAIQYHPEYSSCNKDTVEFTKKLIKDYAKNK